MLRPGRIRPLCCIVNPHPLEGQVRPYKGRLQTTLTGSDNGPLAICNWSPNGLDLDQCLY
jgi:hypothetical protein